MEIWQVNMRAKRLERQTYERKIQEEAAIKQREKTAMKQKVDLHEAYQLILREHHIRVKRRAKQKLLAVSGMLKNAKITPTQEGSDQSTQKKEENPFEIFEDTNKKHYKDVEQGKVVSVIMPCYPLV